MSELGALAKHLRAQAKRLPVQVAKEAADDVVEAAKDGFPGEHIRTGAARDAIEAKASGSRIRLKCGVRKKASKSGKRRKSRTGKVNYAQFIPTSPWDEDKIGEAIESAVDAMGPRLSEIGG
jgi:hypothetical protein